MNDTAPTHHRRALALGVLAVCVGLGVMLCTVALAATAVRSPRDAANTKPSIVQRAAIPSLPVAATAVGPATRSLTLAWDASPDAGVTNYSVSYGIAPGVYTNAQNFGLSTTGTISNLISGVRYYAAARAHGASGLASVFSNEIHAPSNAVYVPVVEVSPDLQTWTAALELPEVTNTPLKFVRINNQFKRWE